MEHKLGNVFFNLNKKYLPAGHPFSTIFNNKSIKLSYCYLPIKQNLEKLFLHLISKNLPAEHPFLNILIKS